MTASKFKRSIVGKFISLSMIASFSLYNCHNSFAVPSLEVKSPDMVSESETFSVENIGIAIDAGTVRSKFSGKTDKVIVHIQDAHCNFEAQNNISRILEQLSRDSGIDMISVEGAEGNVDTAWFKAFPDAEIRREVATYFMKKGEITGAEFFSINSDYSGTIFGAETRNYYVENLRAFLDMYPFKDSIISYLNDLDSVGERLKAIVYPPKLKELDQKISAFGKKELDLSKYAEYLNKAAEENKVDLKQFVNFTKLTETLEYEKKIDFEIVDGERTEYIDMLSKKLTKERMSELVSQSVMFKKGHIKAVDFYSFLRDLAKENDISMVSEYPNLFYYYIYSKIYDGINIEGLFSEIDLIVRQLKEKLIKDETQLKLDMFSEKVEKLIGLVNIELTNDDYDRFRKYADSFSIDDVVSFYDGMVKKYNLNYSIGTVPVVVRENLPKMVDFYEIAMKRDKALIENTLAQMEKEGKDRSVLIAGGFHTKGMVDLLEKRGVSYVVVTPKITKDVESPYIQVLTNQRTSIEDIVTESAAMPGTQKATAKNVVTDPFKDFLAPVYASWTIKTGSVKLAEIFAPIGKEKVDAMVSAMEGLLRDVNGMYVAEWMGKVIELGTGLEIKGDVIPAISSVVSENEALRLAIEDGTFLAVITSAYIENFERIEGELVDQNELELQIEGIERQYVDFASQLGVGVAPEMLEENRQNRLGQQAAGEVLTQEEDDIFRAVLKDKFAARQEGRVYEVVTPDGFKVQLHDNLIYDLVKAGLPLNKAANVRPSKYDGNRQMHIDREVYDNLSEVDKQRLIQHEEAHIQIALADASLPIVSDWNAWPDQTPQGQEDFLRDRGFDVSDIAEKINMMAVGLFVKGNVESYDESRSAEASRMTVARGDAIPGTDSYDYTEEVVFETSNSILDFDIVGVHDEMTLMTSSDFSRAPETLAGRQYLVKVKEGEVEVKIGNKDPEPLSPLTMIDSLEDVEFRKVGSRPAVVKFFYSPDEREMRAYATIAAVAKHAGVLAEMDKPVMVHAPSALFASGNDIGSAKWIQKVMRQLTHPKFRLATYTSLSDLGNRPSLDAGFTHVVIGTQDDLNASLQNPAIESKLKEVRLLPIDNNAVKDPNVSWDFNVEAVGWAMIAGASTPEQVHKLFTRDDFTSPAADIYKFLSQILKRPINVQDLYMIFPEMEVLTARDEGKIMLDDQFVNDFLSSTVLRVTNLVNKILFSMPIRAFDPMAALKQRLQVMWSV